MYVIILKNIKYELKIIKKIKKDIQVKWLITILYRKRFWTETNYQPILLNMFLIFVYIAI